jgi:hypothetical protein
MSAPLQTCFRRRQLAVHVFCKCLTLQWYPTVSLSAHCGGIIRYPTNVAGCFPSLHVTLSLASRSRKTDEAYIRRTRVHRLHLLTLVRICYSLVTDYSDSADNKVQEEHEFGRNPFPFWTALMVWLSVASFLTVKQIFATSMTC